MKIFKILLFCFFLITVNKSYGQEYRKMVKLSYGAGYTLGDLGKYIEGKLFDGVALEGKYFLNENLAIGVSTGWNSFSKKYERQIYQYQNGEISAVQTRYFRSIPMLFTGHYFLGKEESKVRPYAGVGLGAFQLRYEKWYGAFIEGKEKWSPGVRPELGVMIAIGEKAGLDFNLKYNYALYSYSEVKDFHFAEASLGVFLKIY